jgi:hypothetical protein
MKDIYISRNGNQEGPYSEEEINSLIAKSELSLNDFIWCEGMTDWTVVSAVLDSPIRATIQERIPESLATEVPIPEPEIADHDFVPEKTKPAKADHWSIEEKAGNLDVYDDRLTITPKGVLSFLNRGLQGTKTIYFHSITGIQLKMASDFTAGYLQFTIPGGNESRKGLLAAISDENTFLFREPNNHQAEAVKDYIETRMKEIRAPKPATSSGLSDELSRLADLKKQGMLSDEEFQAAKKRLIG